MELQLQKLQKKLSHFEAVEVGLNTERSNLQRERAALLAHRAALQEQTPAADAGTTQATVPM